MRPIGRLALVLVLLAVVVVLAIKAGGSDSTPQKVTTNIASDVAAKIPTSGAVLAAEVVTPKGRGPHPLVVMPGGWKQPATGYRGIARSLAEQGYLVVAYAQRGFAASTGEVDFAGPSSQHDVSAVVDWALAHTGADAKRVGLFATSYGAGVSLLAAARDPRVKAVVAFSTWADEGESYDPSNTPSTAALTTLIGNAKPGARFGPTVRSLQRTLTDHPAQVGAAVRAISKARSPGAMLAKLNANKPAIMIANGFEDTIFPAGQLVPFFTALTTPKLLELGPGDHGAPALAALAGAPSATFDDAVSWLDHYLRGIANGVDAALPIKLRDVQTNQLHAFRSWPQPAKKDTITIGPPGGINAHEVTTWSAAIRSGTDTTARSGPAQLFSTASAFSPPQADLSKLDRTNAFVWSGPALTSGIQLAGTPTLRVLLGSSSPDASIFVYLYDVASARVARLVDVQPYTATGLSSGERRPVTIAMQPVAWAVPTGHHLAIVVDTVDGRYHSLSPHGATITVASDNAHPATFTTPSG